MKPSAAIALSLLLALPALEEHAADLQRYGLTAEDFREIDGIEPVSDPNIFSEAQRYAQFQSRTLSYGDQRRLEIARALATDPKLLALDEPAAGMNATEKIALRGLLERIRDDGRTILLIEHDVKLVMGLCDRVTVLDYGKVIAQGLPDAVRNDKAVIEAYLGGASHG